MLKSSRSACITILGAGVFRTSSKLEEKVPFVLHFSWWQKKMKETLCWNVILATSELCTDRLSFFSPASLSSLSLYCRCVFLPFLVPLQYWFFTLCRLRLENKRGSLLGKLSHIIMNIQKIKSPTSFLFILLIDCFLQCHLLMVGYSVDGQVQVLLVLKHLDMLHL